MGVIVPSFESNAVTISNAIEPGAAPNSNVFTVGHQDVAGFQAFAGICLNVSFTQSGGTTDSILDVKIVASYDNVVSDTDAFMFNETNDTIAATVALEHTTGPSFRVPFGVAGKSGTQRRTVMFDARTFPPAFFLNYIQDAVGAGDRTLAVTTVMRRYVWQQVMG